MNMKQLTMAAAVSAAIGGAGFAQAQIGGVPGEALLLPWITPITYVQLLTPGAVGEDTVINNFTAPNTTPGTYGNSNVHWFLFDPESKHVCDGAFPMTPDDLEDFFIFQLGNGCFGDDGDDETFGYAIFVDQAAVNGGPASRPMFGDAFIPFFDDFISVPVVPMSDGPDTGIGPRIGNEVTYGQLGGSSVRISQASPIAAGIRYDDDSGAVGNITTEIDHTFWAGVGEDSIAASFHFFWFDRNDAGRFAFVDTVDDDENRLSCVNEPMPIELNLVLVAPNFDTGNPEYNGKAICGGYHHGFLAYNVTEYADSATGDGVESSGYSWATHFLLEGGRQFSTAAWNTEAKLNGKFVFLP